ncbi:rhomboid family intramembrane serine protease [Mycobacterium kiyosense]|uniref:Rhomboid family intramembrane serine protease n=2 Tax=Mycobacteriaceae TaxID=1762 RepID=A0A9P3Q6D6_9MYCO|nr:rhomboid family intramembrane serine protease [Mycobacterium kiyosense]BDE11711.1 rhomboid family intramembrane serine protease [Mycobacterium sp. 20KCMC460]GLB85028.1 rhomboid family intramembrane serine protease [Mycobacterium kiyosense]GLB88050.1 rhomboid family intramembrane serine protease [Mycobacterium kiyosense]GLB95392.1 rhomboid family intramembrane serine protease [Mycobacterium kiyosense]
MRSAAVGHQCVDCVQQGAATVRDPRTRFGGRDRAGAPVVTYVLIALNVLAFMAESASIEVQRQLSLWPPGVAVYGQLYRLVTSAFMHYGPAHLLLNMWALYVVGPPLEMWLGRLRFSALYALSGLGGSVLVYLISPLNSATAGASGALFGLFAATFVVAKRLTLDVRWVVAVIVINLAFTFVVPLISSQQISWQGHLGGLVTGGLIAAAYVYAPRHRRDLIQASVTVFALAVFAVLIWWRTGELFTQLTGA